MAAIEASDTSHVASDPAAGRVGSSGTIAPAPPSNAAGAVSIARR
jgi:hypothetical protein